MTHPTLKNRLRAYRHLKSDAGYRPIILLIRAEDNYDVLEDDAVAFSAIIGTNLTHEPCGTETVRRCSFHASTVQAVRAKLKQAGRVSVVVVAGEME